MSVDDIRARPIYRFDDFIGRYEPVAYISLSANLALILTIFFTEYLDVFPE